MPKASEVGYQQQVGTLTLPSAGLEGEPVLEGGDAPTVDLGVGRLGQSALPGWLSADGTSGEMILLGHRTSKSAPFADLVLVTVGDRLLFTDSAGVDHPFVVDDVSVVPFDESMHTPAADGRQAVRLIACTCPVPDGGVIADAKGGCVSHRIVVSAVASR
ncbi:MAG: sortase [Ilumatobacteraceae bacterium]|nr:sortase [Ilumatobacteraceae bacterium]